MVELVYGVEVGLGRLPISKIESSELVSACIAAVPAVLCTFGTFGAADPVRVRLGLDGVRTGGILSGAKVCGLNVPAHSSAVNLVPPGDMGISLSVAGRISGSMKIGFAGVEPFRLVCDRLAARWPLTGDLGRLPDFDRVVLLPSFGFGTNGFPALNSPSQSSGVKSVLILSGLGTPKADCGGFVVSKVDSSRLKEKLFGLAVLAGSIAIGEQ